VGAVVDQPSVGAFRLRRKYGSLGLSVSLSIAAARCDHKITTIGGLSTAPNDASNTASEQASGGGHGHGSKAIIAIAKFVGFLITGSASLLAEAGHSVADTTNQGLLLLGGRQAKKEESDTHQFGYGMNRYFWSFVVALILFSFGSIFALYEGIKKLGHPHELESPAVAVGILSVAILLESYSFKTAIAESRPLKGNKTWWQFIRQAKVPELPVLLLEDSGALVGLVLALAGTGLTLITGDAKWDAFATIGIGILLAIIAVILIVEMRSLLLGEAADPESALAIERAISSHPSVKRFIHARTMHVGPEDVLVATKVEFERGLDFAGVAAAIDSIEADIRKAEPAARLIYIEPAVYDPARLPGSTNRN
jgi:cation diffusion facilitator family transporter